MGTWDVGPFDNDTAADFCGDLDDAPAEDRLGLVRAALSDAADEDGELDAGVAETAGSELLDLWEESDGEPWRKGVEGLRRVLRLSGVDPVAAGGSLSPRATPGRCSNDPALRGLYGRSKSRSDGR